MTSFSEYAFYGGAIQGAIPTGWVDGSTLREVPDHQELFLSPSTLSNLILEINQRVTQEQALSALDEQSALRGGIPATPETIDKAAAIYHLRDLCDEDDQLQVVLAPAAVSMARIPASRAYKGVVQITSPKQQRRDTNTNTNTGRVPVSVSVGGAAAGSSIDGPRTSRVTCHYLLVRLEEQESDVLVFYNVPHEEFDLAGDPRGLSREEEVAAEGIDKMVETLEVKDWGLFA
ncbi:Ran GTPase-binding protein MOG1 [Aspergillus clavatus NRRL 1]|uniref:Ran-interacting protein Mog1, putative n=1 Tax=Aspergillus clavatus (strain ATCC 1007 / CBS 513.65 / DSM 816 / NCTC 3887 / NRRL 1 / QM 1276 / 107) TaxID=344612 RepID=A1CU85_ASPCL|nr:Ran-interacting protein Mog1, putative [Aspergillus clavatus NRRL 1]EAW06872.1 Ran-interacting protein Mog1, putative [Aspergillus clavatus NRRL 1]